MSVSNLFFFKRPNGFWYIIYTVNGRRVWKSTKCTDKREAVKKLAEFNSVVKEKPTSNRLPEFIDDFLSYAKSAYGTASIDIFFVYLRNLQAKSRSLSTVLSNK